MFKKIFILKILFICVLTLNFSFAKENAVKIIIPFPPGGSSDSMLRILVPRLAQEIKRNIIIENKHGAGGNIGIQLLSKSPANGDFYGVGAAGALSANKSLYSKLPYDVEKDIKTISRLAEIPFVLVGSNKIHANDLQELLKLLDKNSNEFSIGHGGNGTAMHLSAELFKQMAADNINIISYRGSSHATLDVISNQIDLAITDLPSSLQQINSGKIRAYAVTSEQRLEQLPNIPTLQEGGLTGYAATGWFGMIAPNGISEKNIQLISNALDKILSDDQTIKSLRNLGLEAAYLSPLDFDEFIKSETSKWDGVVKKSQIKLD